MVEIQFENNGESFDGTILLSNNQWDNCKVNGLAYLDKLIIQHSMLSNSLFGLSEDNNYEEHLNICSAVNVDDVTDYIGADDDIVNYNHSRDYDNVG